MTAKRLFDILFAAVALILLGPLLMLLALVIWAQDGHCPFHLSARVGRGNRDFRMLKLRSMVVGAEGFGASSAARSDLRITPFGRFLRRWKLDEMPQFVNVLAGQMSIVGPRPNLRRSVDSYVPREVGLLAVRPGLTDLASIVFADEAEILEGRSDADAAYDQLIRPWKCKLGLLYIERRNFATDLRLVGLTTLTLVSRRAGLRGVGMILASWGADPDLRTVCARSEPIPAALSPQLPV